MPGPIFTPGRSPLGSPEFSVPQPSCGPRYGISGVTRDSAAAPLGGCTVKLFRTRTDVEVDEVISDGSGNYSFPNVTAQDDYYVVAYLPGAPDRAGTTLNTLIGS